MKINILKYPTIVKINVPAGVMPHLLVEKHPFPYVKFYVRPTSSGTITGSTPQIGYEPAQNTVF